LAGTYEVVLASLKEEQQVLLLNKLIKSNLLNEETALKYLQATTPPSIKLLLLSHLRDREIVPIKQLQSLLQKEGNEEVRECILQIFFYDSKNLNEHLSFLKKYAANEQDADARYAVLHFLKNNIRMTSRMISFYIYP